jgi:hypothetical protein
MDLDGWVLRDGDAVEAAGRVVAVAGEVRFEPPLARRPIRYTAETRPAPKFSGLGIPVRGVELSALQDRFDKDGATEGFATLRGRWDAGALHVTDQGPPQWPVHPRQEWEDPPCPAPAGGWPHGRENENLELPDELVQDPAVATLLMVRPSATQVVLTVVSRDPEGTWATWSPVFPGRLCVVKARWPRGKVETLSNQAQSRMPQFQAYQVGPGTDAVCQPVVTLHVVRVLPTLIAWAADLPDGILDAHAWLHPLSTARGDPGTTSTR